MVTPSEVNNYVLSQQADIQTLGATSCNQDAVCIRSHTPCSQEDVAHLPFLLVVHLKDLPRLLSLTVLPQLLKVLQLRESGLNLTTRSYSATFVLLQIFLLAFFESP
mmetsp:Transcript_62609/g.111353  ORF Transcript_62609/g.111353 Transcript_62609/m.111353 type:complete len:107 (-) Transcript_62609:754-1074(-)